MTEAKTQLNKTEIEEIVRKHELWLTSGRKEGAQADFSNKIIVAYNFTGKQLSSATFYNACLYNCNFTDANLTDASFLSGEVVRSNFKSANLDNADFSWGVLKSCALEDSKHVNLKAFRRTNLRASILPEYITFDGLISYTDDLIKKSRNVFGVGISFSILALFILLFGNNGHETNTVSIPLVLLRKDIVLEPYIALILNLFALTIIGIFYSLSLSAIKKTSG